MRHLRAAFPDAMITACDLNRDAVDYCVRTFDATGVYADRSVGGTVMAGRFDLIWCGSKPDPAGMTAEASTNPPVLFPYE